MSGESAADLVRASIAAFNRRDVDALRAMWGDDVEFDVTDVLFPHQGGRGHGSGVEVEARRGHVMRPRHGKIWRVKVYADPAAALAAAGLRE